MNSDIGTSVIVGLLVGVLVLLIFKAGDVATQNYVRTSRYGAARATFVRRGTIGVLILLVVVGIALGLGQSVSPALVLPIAVLPSVVVVILAITRFGPSRTPRTPSKPPGKGMESALGTR